MEPTPLPPDRTRQVFLGFLVIVVVAGAWFVILRDSDTGEVAAAAPAEPSDSGATVAPATTNPPRPTIPLVTADVEATSEYGELHATHLIDGDTDSYWNDNSLKGEDAALTFSFPEPVVVTTVEIQNVLDEATFRRNYRIRGYEVTFSSGAPPVTGILQDTNRPQNITLEPTTTDTLTISVMSTYPAQPYEGLEPFEELAVAELRFFGYEPQP